ncbi:Fic family protein [Actinoalloteichus sp. GBA129-24]|uniref:Fic family protein n=1 Tax=Actinoalloteichus sp. GBA129-24 TaxID=1612551 RepID=UPI0009509E2E|nr:hypothetical protein [Actinoalloteichus sp. GBA129-24]APU21269.1 hypothetical protein UA75_16305 [Actinoalloteichus sp. GBA129-24]
MKLTAGGLLVGSDKYLTHGNSTIFGFWPVAGGSTSGHVGCSRFGYEWMFVPTPLRSIALDLQQETHATLGDAQEQLARLDEVSARLSTSSTTTSTGLVTTVQAREMQSSSALRGVSVSLRDLLTPENSGSRQRLALPVEFSRYREGARLGFELAHSGGAIDMALMARSRALLSGASAAEGLRQGEHLLSRSSDIDRRPTFAASGADLAGALAAWDAWNSSDWRFSRVSKIIFGLYQLEVLAPFEGRGFPMPGLYVSWALVREGLLRDQLLPIAAWRDRNREECSQQLARVIRTGAFDPWVEFVAAGLMQEARNQLRVVQDLAAVQQDLRDRVTGTGMARDVAAALIGSPVTTHADISARHKITEKAATEIARKLMAAGVLR